MSLIVEIPKYKLKLA